ncbi:DMT family transporter [Luteolibacter arcticus]|uniref:DMT family transporter n=1 Tax=Luteolibacter arcticus TaxID=1581411 RepID=A0ABT3GR55_9BACT|nr:DMT family transporter [Luteolibacter arcticus]MCW1925988.1 DMT family transporter [Luteolibacter arcticus]
MNASRKGMLFGLAGVMAFGLTLPATRLAVASLDPAFVGLGRAAVAALPAAMLLFLTKQPFPSRDQWQRLAIVVLGVIVGFPLSIGWAMQRVDASHGGVVLGLLPLATACAAFLRAGENPSRRFWVCSLAGSVTVVAFALTASSGKLTPADGALLLAVAFAAIGYAEGGRLARELGGWQVMCWSLAAALPFILGPLIWLGLNYGVHGTTSSWAGFAYLSLVSSFLGMFAWYQGLALGGVAKVGQIQLLQPFFTFLFAMAFLGERFGWQPVACAALVAGLIALGRRGAGPRGTSLPLSRAPTVSSAET